MPLYQLPAIVLRTYPFQENHLIITLLSPSKGKIRTIAKGCRRLQSSLGRLVQPMVYGLFLLAEGKNIDVVTQGEIKAAFPKIRNTLERLAHGLYAMELIERFVEEPEPQPDLFSLLLLTLEGLENGQPPPALLRGYEANLLRLLGYAPELDSCVQCKNATTVPKTLEHPKFSNRMGGILCSSCHEIDKQASPLEPEVLSALRVCFRTGAGKTPEFSPTSLPTVTGIFQRFMEEKCGKSLSSFRLLEEVDRLYRGI